MARKPDPLQRLDFLYDFGRREFNLRFDNRLQAALYQATNSEARILENRPQDVWLPLPLGMTSLRSSSVGMVVVFQTREAADIWQQRTCLGTFAGFSDGGAVVYFKRDWEPGEMEEKLHSKKRLSFNRPPSSPSLTGTPNTRPNSGRIEVNVRNQRASERSPGY